MIVFLAELNCSLIAWVSLREKRVRIKRKQIHKAANNLVHFAGVFVAAEEMKVIIALEDLMWV